MLNMHSSLISEATKCENQWNKYAPGLLDGITDPSIRATTAVLMENQRLANNMITEAATDTSDVAKFKRISVPLVRRVFPNLIANKIVTVQPLLGPTGLIYYHRFRYSSNKGAVRGADNNGGFPGDDDYSLGQKASGDANVFEYYASQFVENETQTNAGGGVALTYQLEKTPVLSATLLGSVYDGTTVVATFTSNAAGTFTITDLSAGLQVPTAGSVNLTTGLISLTWDANPGANSVVVSYEYNMECNQDLPEINLSVENEEVHAKKRALKAAWSPEVAQDIRAQHGLDLEQEITSHLATELNLEIDREIIRDLRTNAGTVSTWDFSTALGSTIKERYESLYVKISEVSNVIMRKTLRGRANWVIVSPEVSAVLETATAGFAPSPSDTFTSSIGVQYVGTVNRKFSMYVDPLFPKNQVLMGYKGDGYSDTGYYFLPYVPLEQSPVLMDPESGCPRKILYSRYGKKMLRDGGKFFARLNISGLHV